MCYTEADTPGLWFPEVKAEQLISAGQMLGRIEDLEGRILQTIHARWDGMALYHAIPYGFLGRDNRRCPCGIREDRINEPQ